MISPAIVNTTFGCGVVAKRISFHHNNCMHLVHLMCEFGYEWFMNTSWILTSVHVLMLYSHRSKNIDNSNFLTSRDI